MARRLWCGAVLALVVAGLPLAGAAKKVPVPHPHRHAPEAPEPPRERTGDLENAIPARDMSKLPSTADQFRGLKTEIMRDKPAVDAAKSTSDALALQAETLQQRLVATAARVEALEQEKAQLGADIVRLTAEDERLSASFARDRMAVSRLLAILERLQHDLPPAMVLRPNDALSAARGAMLVGASLPGVYGAAAELSRRIATLRRTRQALVERRVQAAANAERLAQARIELDQLLAMKRLEADAASSHYGDLKRRFDVIATRAANLQALLQKVAALRNEPAIRTVVTVTAEKGSGDGRLGRNALLAPVVGEVREGGMDGVGGASAPGLTYLTDRAAQVISPADGTVLFAGPYHKTGQVLILEMTGGYDAVLAGLDRLDVRPDDHVLAGEPVGTMSKSNPAPRLYFELRQNGRGMSPGPYMSVALRKAKRS